MAPKTAENFRLLCAGESVDEEGVQRTFKNCEFHRAVQDAYCQAGLPGNNDGTGGWSGYKERTFDDENFILRHTGPGILSMVNSGPDSNTSSFLLTFAATDWLDLKHVVFGYVVGLESMLIVGRMHDVATACGEPLERISITECGQLYP